MESDGKTSRGRRLLVAVAVVIIVGAIGLGLAALVEVGPFGGDDELTREEFVSRGNEICRQGREEFAGLQKQPPRTPQDAAKLTGELIGITEREISELQGLGAPAESERALDRYLRAREDGLEILREGQRAAEDEDAVAYARAQAEIAKGQVERAKLAREAGSTDCSRPLGGAPTPAQTPSG